MVLFFDYPEQGGTKPLLNTGTVIPQMAGILIDYHCYYSFNIRQCDPLLLQTGPQGGTINRCKRCLRFIRYYCIDFAGKIRGVHNQ
jgi:hypothetical protein